MDDPLVTRLATAGRGPVNGGVRRRRSEVCGESYRSELSVLRLVRKLGRIRYSPLSYHLLVYTKDITLRHSGLIIVLLLPTISMSDATLARVQETPKQATQISSLAWLTGHWHRTTGKQYSEEHWTAPRGGTMLGVGRTIQGGRTVFFEYLRIEDRGKSGVAYVALPKGANKEVAFKLTSLKASRVVFENPSHDFPRRISYWIEKLDDVQMLVAEIDDGPNGKGKKATFRFQRGASPPSAK